MIVMVAISAAGSVFRDVWIGTLEMTGLRAKPHMIKAPAGCDSNIPWGGYKEVEKEKSDDSVQPEEAPDSDDKIPAPPSLYRAGNDIEMGYLQAEFIDWIVKVHEHLNDSKQGVTPPRKKEHIARWAGKQWRRWENQDEPDREQRNARRDIIANECLLLSEKKFKGLRDRSTTIERESHAWRTSQQLDADRLLAEIEKMETKFAIERQYLPLIKNLI